MSAARVVVVGGGIAGLTAAYRLRRLLGPSAVITVVEQTDRLGGKLRTVDLAGARFDVGAEAFLNRRPEAAALCAELGLAEELIEPTAARSTVLAGGATRALPSRTMLGIPTTPDSVRDLLSPAGLRQVAAEPTLPPIDLAGADVGLGGLLRSRFGDELADRLIDPLLGGVYAGGADGLGLRAVMPPIAAALDRGIGSLTEAAAEVVGSGSATGPVFRSLRGGLGVLVDRLAVAADAVVRLGVPVRSLTRNGAGWRLVLGAAASAHAPADPVLDADAVVLAVPAPAARRLLADVAPTASAALAEVSVASVAVIGLALPPGTVLPGSSGVSGVLVGAGERTTSGRPYAVKAITYSAAKWGTSAGSPVLVRASVGRHGDPGALHADDDELLRLVRSDLAEFGVDAAPIDSHVCRWGGGLPQYAVGHVALVDRLERAVAELPGLAVAGAVLHGVGVPACIGSGDAAASRVAAHLRVPVIG